MGMPDSSQQCIRAGGHGQPSGQACSSFTAQGKADLTMRLREALGGSAMALGQIGQTFGKRLARAIGVYAEEAANFNLQSDNVAIPRCIAKLPEIAAMHSLGLSGACGTTGAPAIRHRAHKNRFTGNNDLINRQKSGKKAAEYRTNSVLDHYSRIGEAADFSCASLSPREAISLTLRESRFRAPDDSRIGFHPCDACGWDLEPTAWSARPD